MEETVFQLDLINQYTDFARDEPASERDRDIALEAIARISASLSHFLGSAKTD
jgi:hypothetical protein